MAGDRIDAVGGAQYRICPAIGLLAGAVLQTRVGFLLLPLKGIRVLALHSAGLLRPDK
jgi:hypothetical protein